MKNPLRAMLVVAVCSPAIAQAGNCDSLEPLRWLLGDWAADGSKSSFHETWAEFGPRTFEGTGVERLKSDGTVKSGEVLRLVEMAGEVFYISKVTHNQLPVAFRLSECEADRFVFVNPGHDFPRRLEYQRGEQGALTVRVNDGGDKGFTLDFARVADSPAGSEPVLAAEDARFSAMIAANPTEMHRWLAADLEYVHSTGEVDNRDQFINSIISGSRRYIAVEPGERRVTFLGEGAAVVQGPARFQVSAGATPADFKVRYLAVYVHVEGTWQLHAWQSLRLPEE